MGHTLNNKDWDDPVKLPVGGDVLRAMCQHQRILYVQDSRYRALIRTLANKWESSIMSREILKKEFEHLHMIAHAKVTFN